MESTLEKESSFIQIIKLFSGRSFFCKLSQEQLFQVVTAIFFGPTHSGHIYIPDMTLFHSNLRGLQPNRLGKSEAWKESCYLVL